MSNAMTDAPQAPRVLAVSAPILQSYSAQYWPSPRNRSAFGVGTKFKGFALSRNASLDVLKMTMALMVIGLHTEFLIDFSALSSYLTVNGIFRIAVPIFLIINGFYFYPIVINKSQLAWFKRIAILYFLWMAAYSYFWFYIPEANIFSIAGFIISFIIGYWHLWYISGLIGAAALTFVLRKSNPILVLSLVIVTFLGGVAIQYAGNYHIFQGTIYDQIFNFHPSHRNAMLFSFPFFCAGYLINKYSICKLIELRTAIFWTVVGVILLLVESYLNFSNPSRDGEFDNFASLALICPAIFIATANINIRSYGKELAIYSSALYFIHVFAIHIIFIFAYFSGSLLTLSVIFVSVLMSIFLVEANKRLKLIL